MFCNEKEKNIKNTLLDFNNGFYTKLVEKHRIGIQGFTEKGFKIIILIFNFDFFDYQAEIYRVDFAL